MKVIKRFVLVLLVLLLIGAGWLTASGYQRYKEAIAEVPLAEKIEAVKQREDYTPLDQISPDFVNAVVAVVVSMLLRPVFLAAMRSSGIDEKLAREN